MRAVGCAIALGIVAVTGAFPVAAGTETSEKTVTREEKLVTGTKLRVENLLGSMTVTGGGAPGMIRIEARIVADADSREQADALAAGIRVERSDRSGLATLRVGYPTGTTKTFRAPRGETNAFQRLIGSMKRDKVSVQYGDDTVEIGPSKEAVAAAVHLKIVVPSDIHASFFQAVGSLSGARVRGTMEFESIAGAVTIEQAYSRLGVRSGGGDVVLRTFKGDSIEIESGAGEMKIDDVQTKGATFKSTSGSIHGVRILAGSMIAMSESGDVQFSDVDPTKVRIETDSGEVDLSTRLRSTHEASIRSGSGDVTLRVGDVTPFLVEAKTTSGSVSTKGVPHLDVLEESKTSAKYRRGSGGVTVSVETASGDVEVSAIR